MAMRCIVGVDLGGTNVRAGTYFEDGSEAGPKFSNPSKAQDGDDAIFHAIAKTIGQAIDASSGKPEAVGMAVPGRIDDSRGMVLWSSNFGETVNGVFHYWRNRQIREPLRALIDLPIFMGNDANLAALGEYRFGAGANSAQCLVLVTLGTGIGGGVVMAPESVLGDARSPLVLLGGNHGGAELGHIVINSNGLDCNAGSYGAIEAYCNRDGIVQRAVHRIQRLRKTMLTEMVGGDLSKLSPKILAEAAHKGDELAMEVFEEVGTMLGVGLGNFINIFAPDVLAVGGQVAKAGEVLMRPAIRSARNVAVPSLFVETRIVIAEKIDDAGMLGGAALAIMRLGRTA